MTKLYTYFLNTEKVLTQYILYTGNLHIKVSFEVN
jgi:hypothetical protein